jgi:hypothetical protein
MGTQGESFIFQVSLRLLIFLTSQLLFEVCYMLYIFFKSNLTFTKLHDVSSIIPMIPVFTQVKIKTQRLSILARSQDWQIMKVESEPRSA